MKTWQHKNTAPRKVFQIKENRQDPGRVDVDVLVAHGRDLYRPECVLATASGSICTSDWNGGVCIIDRGGRQYRIAAADPSVELRPNGITLLPDGSFLLAQLGDSDGGLYRLHRDGGCEPYLLEIEGLPLPPSNYAHRDHLGRTWMTVSTRHVPRASAYRGDVSDGFIVLIDPGGARIVADGLAYTNECCVHPDGSKLYVNETFGRRLTSFDIGPRGDLSRRRTITEFGHGTYPDGLAFDSQGAVWVTSIVSNRVIRVTPDGEQTVLLEDVDREHLEEVEHAFTSGRMGKPHLDRVSSRRLKNISSLAFGGPDLSTVYLGCLLGDHILSFNSPVPGWPPPYWHHPL